MGREVLVGQPFHWLHGSDGATPIRRDTGPSVAADVLQTGNRLSALRGAGIHAGLPLAGFTAVGPTGQAEALGVACRAVVMILLAGRALQISFLIAVLA